MRRIFRAELFYLCMALLSFGVLSPNYQRWLSIQDGVDNGMTEMYFHAENSITVNSTSILVTPGYFPNLIESYYNPATQLWETEQGDSYGEYRDMIDALAAVESALERFKGYG